MPNHRLRKLGVWVGAIPDHTPQSEMPKALNENRKTLEEERTTVAQKALNGLWLGCLEINARIALLRGAC